MITKLLIVDDSKTFQTIVIKTLASYDLEIQTANNGVEAFALLTTFTPHVIILDYTMPKMDGLEFIDKLRANAQYNPIKIMVLTAIADKRTVLGFLQHKISDYVIKPLDRALFIEKLSKIVPLRKKEDTGSGVSETGRILEQDTFAIKSEEKEAATTVETVPGAKLTIFAVDDKVNVLNTIQTLCKDRFNCVLMTHTNQLIELIAKHKPDLIFLDLSLPDNDALKLAGQLAQHFQAELPPMIAMSIKSTADQMAKRLRESHFAAVLHKPFREEDLTEIIKEHSYNHFLLFNEHMFEIKEGKRAEIVFPKLNSQRPSFQQSIDKFREMVVDFLEELADGGETRVLVKLLNQSAFENALMRVVMSIISHCDLLGLHCRFVTDSDEVRKTFALFVNTSKIRLFDDDASAIASFQTES